jgi:hypothetical protein
MPTPLTTENEASVRQLYDAGWHDIAIGRAFDVPKEVVRAWRRRHGLAGHHRKSKIDGEAALKLHAEGSSDRQMARTLRVSQCATTNWRHKRGLPANGEWTPALDPKLKRAVKKKIRLGASSAQVAEAVGLKRAAVMKVRDQMSDEGLRPQGVSNNDIRRRVLGDPTIERRIRQAVGIKLPRDVQCEAFGDLFTDVSGAWSTGGSSRRLPRIIVTAHSS